MKYIWLIMAILIVAPVVMADWPSGGGYQLRWGAVTNGGTESEPRECAAGYFVTDNLGNASHVTDSFLTDGTTYINRPGYRKVEWDEREPITSVDGLGPDTISSAPNFPLSWGGADTTIEDGIGWGIRYYDIQYRINAGGTWQDWDGHTQTILTADIFGSTYGPNPGDTICEDTTYYFRSRAYDKAGNVEDWPAAPNDWDAWARYEEQVLQWVVENNVGADDWTIGHDIEMDTFETVQDGDVFVVKNRGAVDIDIGVKGFSAVGWTLDSLSGIDKYALRAKFDDNATAPAHAVWPLTDAVRDSGFTWATATLFGPRGFAIEAPPDPDSTDNLWLQLHTPSDWTAWVTDQTIRISLKAKATTP